MSGFGAAGVIALLANIAVTAMLREWVGLAVELAYAGGYTTVLIISFLLCRHAVFDAADGDLNRQFTVFVVSSVFFRGMEFAANVVCYKLFAIQYLWALVMIQSLSFVIKFFYYRAVVFSDDGRPST